jgi:hypothetical protein
MWKALSALAVSALVAGVIALVPGLSDNVQASAPASTKADRADLVDCKRHSWPYYDRGCLRDPAANGGRVKPVRLVTTDRIHSPAPIFVQPPSWLASLPVWDRRTQ